MDRKRYMMMAGAKKKSPCSLSRGYSSLGACLPLSTAPLKANQSTIALCSRCVRSQPIHDCSLWPQVVKRRGMWPQHGCMLAVGEWVQPWLGAFLLGSIIDWLSGWPPVRRRTKQRLALISAHAPSTARQRLPVGGSTAGTIRTTDWRA